MREYLLDNAWREQRSRLDALEAWFDPGTMRHLVALGVGPGWRCLEVGAGGGSIATWLSERVGPDGSVLATDLDTRFLDALTDGRPNLVVRRHDLLADPLPADTFDLIHARFVLEHLPDRMEALHHLVPALRPGGWLCVESTDSSSWLPDPSANPADVALFSRWTAAFQALCLQAGGDANAGRWLTGELRAAGLAHIGAEGRVYMVQGGSPEAEVWRLTASQVSERIVAAGLLSVEDMARTVELMRNPSFHWMEALVMAGWGQRT
ncbi:MAG TPA: methyltransferase [Ktedonobacterales bacterium]